jgi:hypothetical protein
LIYWEETVSSCILNHFPEPDRTLIIGNGTGGANEIGKNKTPEQIAGFRKRYG